MNVYLDLTREFNAGRLRAVITSGQAVVLHQLAIMSKDGDWILRWMASGWSAHLEYRSGPTRVRTDFFTRPPRVTPPELKALWREQEGRDPPFVDARRLSEIKKTDREKDYVVIGELARLMPDSATSSSTRAARAT